MRLRWLVIGALLSLPFWAALFRVWVHHGTVSAGYELSREERRYRELQEEKRRLDVEIATLKSPERLLREARERGMKEPLAEQHGGVLKVHPMQTPRGSDEGH